jgi:hypothetical protein
MIMVPRLIKNIEKISNLIGTEFIKYIVSSRDIK